MAFTFGYSVALSRSNDASIITRSSVSSALKARQSKFDVRIAGSQLLGKDPVLLKLGSRTQYPAKLSISRRVNLTTKCSAVRGEEEEEESAQSAVQTRVSDESVPQLMDVVSKSLQPYLQLARVDKRWLDGSWFLFLWPFYWGVALAAENGTLPDWRILTVLAVAAAILRSAACTVNDLCDKDFDGKVERTKLRPLVTGVLTPSQGWAFLGALLLSYIVVLSQLKSFRLQNQFQVLVAIQLLLNCTYPLAKRWTHLTPAVLGLAINWSVFLGWSAVQGSVALGPPALLPALLFFATWCWTLVYETIYAHQDFKADVDAGIKSMAILLGNDTKLWLTGFGTAFVASLGIVGHIATLGWPFFIAVAASAIHVVWQITTVDINNPLDCVAKFRSNIWVGAFVFGGIVLGKFLA